jgi:hypothetical protein
MTRRRVVCGIGRGAGVLCRGGLTEGLLHHRRHSTCVTQPATSSMALASSIRILSGLSRSRALLACRPSSRGAAAIAGGHASRVTSGPTATASLGPRRMLCKAAADTGGAGGSGSGSGGSGKPVGSGGSGDGEAGKGSSGFVGWYMSCLESNPVSGDQLLCMSSTVLLSRLSRLQLRSPALSEPGLVPA